MTRHDTRSTIDRHCAELDRCNQRGGRMLSIFDLIDRGTLDPDLAAWLMARITRGASFMVGAQPGGAGKTTVMCALLNLVPADVELVAATPAVVRDAALTGEPVRQCYICHEIGAGSYFAYLWGEPLRAYCALGSRGAMLATNLHADDYAEARDQVCLDNGVPEAQFVAFDLLLFLRLVRHGGTLRRVVDSVYALDSGTHRKVFQSGTFHAPDPGADGLWLNQCRDFVRSGLESGLRTIEQTRAAVLDFLQRSCDYS